MAKTLTWDDGVNTPVVYTVNDDVYDSVELYRQTVQSVNPITQILGPTYPDVISFVVASFIRYALAPALQQFPTSAVATAKTAKDSASSDYDTALAAALGTAVVPQ